MTIHQVLMMLGELARQVQVPGQQYSNQTNSSIQAQAPGGAYMNGV